MCKYCSTIVCQTCVDKITDIPQEIRETQIKCHECKNILNVIDVHRNTKRGVENLHVNCPSANINCFEEVCLKDLYRHLEVCKYWEGKGKCNACGFVDTVSNVKKHLDVCKELLIPCNHCDEFFKRKEIPKHEATCFKKPTNCKVCNLKFSQGNVLMKDHPSKDLCVINLVKEVAEKLESKNLK